MENFLGNNDHLRTTSFDRKALKWRNICVADLICTDALESGFRAHFTDGETELQRASAPRVTPLAAVGVHTEAETCAFLVHLAAHRRARSHVLSPWAPGLSLHLHSQPALLLRHLSAETCHRPGGPSSLLSEPGLSFLRGFNILLAKPSLNSSAVKSLSFLTL